LFGDGHRFGLGGLKTVLIRGLITYRVADCESQEEGHCDCYGEDQRLLGFPLPGGSGSLGVVPSLIPTSPPATARYTNVGFLAAWRIRPRVPHAAPGPGAPKVQPGPIGPGYRSMKRWVRSRSILSG
jgi:hypothetical protein